MKIWHALGKRKRVVVFILLFFFLAYLPLFHSVRGEQIVEPSENEYRKTVAGMVHGPVTVHSTEDMQDLVLWRGAQSEKRVIHREASTCFSCRSWISGKNSATSPIHPSPVYIRYTPISG